MYDADRGGFIFVPEVGLHQDVHELDFSSLYPNIIYTRNIPLNATRCECNRDRLDVPGLGCAVCDRRGTSSTTRRPHVSGSLSATRRSRPTTPRTTKHSWSELSRACCHHSDGTGRTFDENLLRHGS